MVIVSRPNDGVVKHPFQMAVISDVYINGEDS